MTSIHHRTITACFMAQRLLNTDPLELDFYPPIPLAQIMAPFKDAARKEIEKLTRDLATPSWVEP